MRALLPVLALSLTLATLTGCGDDTNTPATSSTNNATSSTNSGTTAATSTTGFWAECDFAAPACDEGLECVVVPPDDPLSAPQAGEGYLHRCTLPCHGDAPQGTPDTADDAVCAPYGGVCPYQMTTCVPEGFWLASYLRECQTDAECDGASAQVCRLKVDEPGVEARFCAWPFCEEDSECPGFEEGVGYCLRTVCILWL